MKRMLCGLATAAVSFASLAQSTPVGLWKTLDNETKRERSQVRITESGGVFTARLEKLSDMPEPEKLFCSKCVDDRKDKPLLGLELIRGVRRSGEVDSPLWDGGTLLDPANGWFDWVIVETVGVGQTELDIVRLADTTVVVLVPESGDGIQTMKAGLLEAADILVVNKADREGATRLVTELKYMVHLHRDGQQASRDLDWEVPILTTEAVHDVGVAELLETIGRHRTALEASGVLERRRQARRARELRALLLAELRQEVDRALADGGALERVLADVEAGRVDPYTASRSIADELRLGRRSAP